MYINLFVRPSNWLTMRILDNNAHHLVYGGGELVI